MSEVLMPGHVKVPEDCACGDDAVGHALYPESLQRCRAELLQQPLVGRLGSEYPVIKPVSIKPASKPLAEEIGLFLFEEHLLGLEVAQYLFHMRRIALCNEEFPG